MKTMNVIMIGVTVMILVLVAIYFPNHLGRGLMGGLIALGVGIPQLLKNKEPIAYRKKWLFLIVTFSLISLIILIGFIKGYQSSVFTVSFLICSIFGIVFTIYYIYKYRISK